MKIASKESKETFYWLTLCEKSPHLPFDQKVKDTCEEVIRILSKIVISTKANGAGKTN
jgi:four helix bundle protein